MDTASLEELSFKKMKYKHALLTDERVCRNSQQMAMIPFCALMPDAFPGMYSWVINHLLEHNLLKKHKFTFHRYECPPGLLTLLLLRVHVFYM